MKTVCGTTGVPEGEKIRHTVKTKRRKQTSSALITKELRHYLFYLIRNMRQFEKKISNNLIQ